MYSNMSCLFTDVYSLWAFMNNLTCYVKLCRNYSKKDEVRGIQGKAFILKTHTKIYKKVLGLWLHFGSSFDSYNTLKPFEMLYMHS